MEMIFMVNDKIVFKECDRDDLAKIIKERKIKIEEQREFIKGVMAEAALP
jgi:hypothetical protein